MAEVIQSTEVRPIDLKKIALFVMRFERWAVARLGHEEEHINEIVGEFIDEMKETLHITEEDRSHLKLVLEHFDANR